MNLRKQFGFSVVFITHDLSLLVELADVIAVMYAGKVVETAPSSELYHRPRHPYSQGLLNSFPVLNGPRRTLTGIPGSPPNLKSVPPGCPFHPRCWAAKPPCSTRCSQASVSPLGGDSSGQIPSPACSTAIQKSVRRPRPYASVPRTSARSLEHQARRLL